MTKFKRLVKTAVLFGLFCLIGFIGCGGRASASESTLYPVSILKDDTLNSGYIDETGKLVIQPLYMQAGNFSEGYAVVYTGKLYQVINLKGEVIYKSKSEIKDFHNGLAAFYDPDNYLWGYINTKGKIVIKPQYMNAGDFKSNNTAIVLKKGKFCSINNKGKVLKTYSTKSDNYYYDEFDNGYIITNDSKTFLKGVTTLNGKVILKQVYGEITYLGNNLFGVKKALSDDKSYLYSVQPSAIFDKNGKKLTDYVYYDLSKFTGKYASVTDSKYTYFIGQDGKKVSSLPILQGRGTMELLGDIIQADIDNEQIYMKKDGTVIWKENGITNLENGISVSTVKFKPNKYVIVNYPKVEGLKDSSVQKTLNDKLKSIFTKYRKDLKVSDDLSVCDTFTVKQIRNLLIIRRSGYDYLFGAAHGMPLRNYYFIDINTGVFYELKDLFKNNSDYVTKISKIVKQQMKENGTDEYGSSMYFPDSFKQIDKDQYFYINEDNLTIYFDVYAIAPYAAGFPEFNIPFKDIKDIINTDGAFWKAFH